MLESKPAWIQLFVLCLLTTWLCGCNKSLILGKYPVDVEHSGQLAAKASEAKPLPAGYWSAYVELENQDIPRLWTTSNLDYVIISASVKIPTREKAITREFPLFSMEKGLIQTETGADILRKFPLSSEARDQVSFTVKVTFLKNKQVFDTARSILDRVTAIAKPYLDNYLLAAEIVGSSMDLINELAPAETGDGGFPSSSVTTMIIPSEIMQDASGRQEVLYAFFMLPVWEKTIDADGQTRKTRRDVQDFLNKTFGKSLLVECSDSPGKLCKRAKTDKTKTTEDAAIAALRNDIYALALRQLGSGYAALPRDAKFTQALDAELETLTKKFDALNKELERLRAESRERIERLYDTEDQHYELYISSDPKRSKAEANAHADELRQLERELEQLDDELQREQLDSDDKVVECESLNRELREFRTHARDVMTGYLEQQESTFDYRQHRVDEVVYLTLKFVRYDQVDDPFVELGVARGGDCDQITATSIKDAQSYLSANEALFLDKDVAKHTKLLRLAQQYVDLRELIQRGEFAQSLALITKLETDKLVDGYTDGASAEHYLYDAHDLHGDPYEDFERTQMSAMAYYGDDGLSYCEMSAPRDTFRDEQERASEAQERGDVHRAGVETCMQQLFRRPPTQQLLDAWLLYRTLNDTERSISQSSRKRGADAVIQLDAIALTLDAISGFANSMARYQPVTKGSPGAKPEGSLNAKLEDSLVLRFLDRAAADKLASQQKIVESLDCAVVDKALTALDSDAALSGTTKALDTLQLSDTCDACFERLAQRCSSIKVERFSQYRAHARRLARERILSHR